MVAFIGLYAPILTLVAYSFNVSESAGEWTGVTLDWYRLAFQNDEVKSAALNSLIVAAMAALVSTTVATLAAVGTTRRAAFRGQTTIYAVINQPLMVPEIVTAVALLIFFSSVKLATGYTGLGYLILAHAAFCIPFAYLPIAARLSGIEETYEQAARDLYATRAQAFWLILLPLLMPGVISGYLLAFIISLDDFIITNFVKGAGMETLPTAIFGSVKQGIKPNILALSTLMLTVSILFVTLSYFVNRLGQRSRA